jgi:hypothetical protein
MLWTFSSESNFGRRGGRLWNPYSSLPSVTRLYH